MRRILLVRVMIVVLALAGVGYFVVTNRLPTEQETTSHTGNVVVIEMTTRQWRFDEGSMEAV